MSVLSTPVTNPVDALLDEFKRLASRRDVAAGLQHVVGRLPVLLGIDRAVVYRYNAVNKRLVVTHETRGATPSLLGSMHPLAQLPACMVNALETGLTGRHRGFRPLSDHRESASRPALFKRSRKRHRAVPQRTQTGRTARRRRLYDGPYLGCKRANGAGESRPRHRGEWERLAQEAFFAVLTSKQFSTA